MAGVGPGRGLRIDRRCSAELRVHPVLAGAICLARPAGTSGFGTQNAAVIVAAVVYGVVALVAVLVAASWIVRDAKPFRLATVALGASTLVAGLIVWILPIGREIDGFHGIAQNTSTAGVGFEGYLAWAAAAAILAPLALMQALSTRPIDKNLWRQAARKGLLLIAVWCAGSVVMRITDLFVDGELGVPILALRQHGAGRIRSVHRRRCGLASGQPGQPFPVRQIGLVSMWTPGHPHRCPHRGGDRACSSVLGAQATGRDE